MRKPPPSESGNFWKYCTACHDRWIRPSRSSFCTHVPYRDKASQGLMKQTWHEYKKAKEERETERASQEEEYGDLDEASADRMLDEQEGACTDEVVDAAVFDKEAPDDDPFEPAVPVQLPAPDTMDEDDLFATDAAGRQDNKEGDMEVELPTIPKVVFPTLDQYKAKWASLLEYHARGNDDAYSAENLVPTPQHVLFQDCPHVPFSELNRRRRKLDSAWLVQFLVYMKPATMGVSPDTPTKPVRYSFAGELPYKWQAP